MKKFIIAGFLLSSCGSYVPEVANLPITVDRELLKDFNDFLNLCKVKQIDITCQKHLQKLHSMLLVNYIDDRVIGRCEYTLRNHELFSSKILIKKELLDNPSVLKETVFHEMGHCLLGLDHYDEQPAIMNTYTYYFEDNEWSNAVEFMFKGFIDRLFKTNFNLTDEITVRHID